MKTSPIPEDDQIRAMLGGSVYELLQNYDVQLERIDFRKFITVDRQKLIDFLTSHPAAADSYFRKHSVSEAIHDVEKIWRDRSEYVTAWMDHGRPLSTRRFATLGEAVAEHVLVVHGMY